MAREKKKTESEAIDGLDVKLRIIGEGEEAPDQLLANPKNWRTHPREQREALLDVLKSVGWVQRVIVNKRTGHLIDGHMRVEVAMKEGIPAVPVVYVDVTPEEEDLILASLDPLSGLAGIDKDRLEDLLKGLDPDGTALKAMLADLEAELGIGEADGGGDKNDVETILDQAIQAEPGKELVVIICDSEEEFAELRRLLGLGLVRRGGYRKGSAFDATGVERVVSAGKILSLLEGRR